MHQEIQTDSDSPLGPPHHHQRPLNSCCPICIIHSGLRSCLRYISNRSTVNLEALRREPLSTISRRIFIASESSQMDSGMFLGPTVYRHFSHILT